MFYCPELGRFFARDMIRRPGKNLYTYVENDPLSNVDPLGLQEQHSAQGITGTGTFSPEAIQASGYGSTATNQMLYGGVSTSPSATLISQLAWANQQQQEGFNIMMPVPGKNEFVMTSPQAYINALQNEVAFRNALGKQLELNEARKPGVYLDSRGIPTVGVGFNLRRKDAQKRCESVGSKYEDVLSGNEKLTQEQIEQLLQMDIDDTVKSANRIVKNYGDLPPGAKMVVNDMIFNLGETGFSNFKNLINAVENRNWSRAADEMVSSRWYSQVGNRGPRMANIMRNAGK